MTTVHMMWTYANGKRNAITISSRIEYYKGSNGITIQLYGVER